MTNIMDTIFPGAAELFPYQQAAWEKQKHYVKQYSTFYPVEVAV